MTTALCMLADVANKTAPSGVVQLHRLELNPNIKIKQHIENMRDSYRVQHRVRGNVDSDGGYKLWKCSQSVTLGQMTELQCSQLQQQCLSGSRRWCEYLMLQLAVESGCN